VAGGSRRPVLPLLGQAQQFIRDLKSNLLAGPMQVMSKQTGECGEELWEVGLFSA
jgi:hypothetical protein